MNTIENQKEIVQFGVSISQFNIDNLETGLLTMDKFNELEKGQALALAQETESILRQFVSAFEEHSPYKFEGYDAGILFQYVFDKVVEVTYKPEFGISDSRFSCYARFPTGAYYICPPNNMDGKMQNCKVQMKFTL